MRARDERQHRARAATWIAWLCLLALAVQMLGPALHRMHAHGAPAQSAPRSATSIVIPGDDDEHEDSATCGLCQIFTLTEHHLGAEPRIAHDAGECERLAVVLATQCAPRPFLRDRPPARAPPISRG